MKRGSVKILAIYHDGKTYAIGRLGDVGESRGGRHFDMVETLKDGREIRTEGEEVVGKGAPARVTGALFIGRFAPGKPAGMR